MAKCPLGVKSSLVGNHWSVAVLGILFFLNTDWFKHVSEFWLLRSHRQVFEGDSGKSLPHSYTRNMKGKWHFSFLRTLTSEDVYPGVSILGNTVPIT